MFEIWVVLGLVAIFGFRVVVVWFWGLGIWFGFAVRWFGFDCACFGCCLLFVGFWLFGFDLFSFWLRIWICVC